MSEGSVFLRGIASAKALRQEEWVWWLWDTEKRLGQVACKET